VNAIAEKGGKQRLTASLRTLRIRLWACEGLPFATPPHADLSSRSIIRQSAVWASGRGRAGAGSRAAPESGSEIGFSSDMSFNAIRPFTTTPKSRLRSSAQIVT
jgi:hypothetical protein